MGTALIAAAAALATVLGLWLIAARMRARADRRFELTLARIDEHMSAIVEHVKRAGERIPVPGPSTSFLEPTLDLHDLLEQIAREAAARTAADACGVHVEGPGGISVRGSFGDPPEHELLHGPLDAAAEAYRAVTIDWSHVSADVDRQRLFASALVVPLVPERETRGAIAVYGIAADAFRNDDARVLESLAAEVSPLVASAWRVAAVERRATIDEATGLRNARAYEEELDREVARSRRTGRTFALLVLDLGEDGDAPSPSLDDCLWEVAGLVIESTRSTDVVCRRGVRQFAVLLPETDVEGAQQVLYRLETSMSGRSFHACAPRIRSAAVVEWAQGESASLLDARAGGTATSTTGDARFRRAAPDTPPVRLARALDARDEFLERLDREIAQARLDSRGLSLLLVEPLGHLRADGTRGIDDAATLPKLARRLDESLEGSATCARTGRNQLGVVLVGASDDDAARHFTRLRGWLRQQDDDAGLAAGVTQVTPTDQAETMFGRAEHALWQAKQAGDGNVVVATTTRGSGS